MGYVALIARRRGFPASDVPRSIGNLARALWPALPGLGLPVVVLGGIIGGVFTPTEAGAVAVAYALALGVLLYRNVGLRGIGQEPRVHSYGFCTNATYSAGTAGVPTLGYGPSREELAHVVDEYLEIEDLVAAAAGYGAIATSFLGGSP